MTKRKAIYHKDEEGYRVVSKPGGLWVAQAKGTEERAQPRHKDNWADMHAPTTQAEAIRIMYERKPVKAA